MAHSMGQSWVDQVNFMLQVLTGRMNAIVGAALRGRPIGHTHFLGKGRPQRAAGNFKWPSSPPGLLPDPEHQNLACCCIGCGPVDGLSI